ncbi:MAG: hypothetical protein ABMA02_16840 [Saprospiraceae bacterium]
MVEQLADWLQQQEPGLKGFDRRSLYRMREFFEQWQAVDWAEYGFDEKIGFQNIGTLEEPAEIVVTLSPQSLDEPKSEIMGSTTPQLPPMTLALTSKSWTHHTF